MCICEVAGFDDTNIQLALDIVDQAVVQTLFNKECNREVFNYINKYRQLISQVIRMFKQIDLKNLGKVKSVIRRLKIFKSVSIPNISFNKDKFMERFKKFGFNFEKIKNYMPRFSRTIYAVEEKMSSLGINEEKLNKARSAMADAMYTMSKIYSVFTYANSILKGNLFSQTTKQMESTSQKASSLQQI